MLSFAPIAILSTNVINTLDEAGSRFRRYALTALVCAVIILTFCTAGFAQQAQAGSKQEPGDSQPYSLYRPHGGGVAQIGSVADTQLPGIKVPIAS